MTPRLINALASGSWQTKSNTRLDYCLAVGKINRTNSFTRFYPNVMVNHTTLNWTKSKVITSILTLVKMVMMILLRWAKIRCWAQKWFRYDWKIRLMICRGSTSNENSGQPILRPWIRGWAHWWWVAVILNKLTHQVYRPGLIRSKWRP